jgi:hypothetical protein
MTDHTRDLRGMWFLAVNTTVLVVSVIISHFL